jgi:protein-disulfide isomerase
MPAQAIGSAAVPDLVLAEDRGAVRHLVLNRPDKRNALDLDLVLAIRHGFRAAADDPKVRVVVVRGAGRVFSAGMDVAALAGAARAAIAEHGGALFRDPADPVKGNPQGVVTIVEFFDARCGYCKQLHPVMEQMLRRQRDVRLVLKDLPILGPNSLLASRALFAAQRQGKYAELQDALMRLREEPTETVLRREAERTGLDWERLRRDMADPAIGRRIEANTRLASALRIEGTPALVIGDTLVPGAVDLATLERLIADARTGETAGK